MPDANTVKRAKADLRRHKSPSTAVGEFVREEIHHVREGKHGARSAKQAIAIGLSKARRAGVPLKPPKRNASLRTKKAARQAYAAGQRRRKSSRRPSPARSRAVRRALKREPRKAATHRALARQATTAARRRGARARKQAAMKAVRTKGPVVRRRAARKAAATRKRRASA